MDKSLPQFKARPQEAVAAFMTRVLSHDPEHKKTHLREIIIYDDGHYRAIFAPAYFTLQPGQAEPSKSQWSNLKKRMKRHDPQVFVFKETGGIRHQDEELVYVDFGFFAH